jgi:hypothetical protein
VPGSILRPVFGPVLARSCPAALTISRAGPVVLSSVIEIVRIRDRSWTGRDRPRARALPAHRFRALPLYTHRPHTHHSPRVSRGARALRPAPLVVRRLVSSAVRRSLAACYPPRTSHVTRRVACASHPAPRAPRTHRVFIPAHTARAHYSSVRTVSAGRRAHPAHAPGSLTPPPLTPRRPRSASSPHSCTLLLPLHPPSSSVSPGVQGMYACCSLPILLCPPALSSPAARTPRTLSESGTGCHVRSTALVPTAPARLGSLGTLAPADALVPRARARVRDQGRRTQRRAARSPLRPRLLSRLHTGHLRAMVVSCSLAAPGAGAGCSQ